MMKLVPLMLFPLFALILFSAYSASSAVEKSGLPVRGDGSNSPSSAVERAGPFSFRGFLPFLFSLSLFSAVSLVTFILLDFAIDHGAFLGHFSQSWTSHFGAQQSFEYGSARDHPFDWSLLWKHWDTTLPAVLGLFFVSAEVMRRAGEPKSPNEQIPPLGDRGFHIPVNLFPFIWLVYSLLVFALHKPWWSYYYVHIAVPIAWCAAIGLVRVAADVRRRWQLSAEGPKGKVHLLTSAATIFFLLAAIAWSCGRVYLQIRTIRESPQIYSDLVIPEIARFKPFTQFLYADEPIYSFHTGVPMPPNLAVVMYKRLWSGDMTNDKITTELIALQPGLILLKNDARVVPFKQLLETEYRLVYYDSAHRLYAHRSIARKASL